MFPHACANWCVLQPLYRCTAAGAFENTVQALYKYVVPKPREECTKTEQLTVSFAAGYIAGVFCAVVSHPADNLVSKLNAQKGATAGDIIKQMGWYALFTRGLGLRIIMIGTLTGLQVGAVPWVVVQRVANHRGAVF
jgi:solute carrier family 25 phosphate transporter 3